MYKFRSMIVEAEGVKDRFNHLNEMSGPVFKLSNDPRCTLIGKWLRKFSVDELPQLVNILKGDMSFVGPRPPIPEEVEQYERWQRRRLRMKPGLTCLWQAQGRNDIDFDEWMKLDLQYIDTLGPCCSTSRYACAPFQLFCWGREGSSGSQRGMNNACPNPPKWSPETNRWTRVLCVRAFHSI